MKVKWTALIWFNFSFKKENEMEDNQDGPLLLIKRAFMSALPMVFYQSGFVLYQQAVEVLNPQSD